MFFLFPSYIDQRFAIYLVVWFSFQLEDVGFVWMVEFDVWQLVLVWVGRDGFVIVIVSRMHFLWSVRVVVIVQLVSIKFMKSGSQSFDCLHKFRVWVIRIRMLIMCFIVGCGMEENVNCRSNESLATSEEYEFVTPSSNQPLVNPELQIDTTTIELERTLTEVF